ncbi:uncharacterized protein LOC114268855 isoform X1 [Camellia sinensis]|uniref:uncharacterized protein LOC114268855 isoform X1 n=1 Tax=Camellia sinensis TaxID=4442 RepID=UPI001036596D|nr:uncharacterized protein LOC114268855 isoform X1 [Camellia sinensis]
MRRDVQEIFKMTPHDKQVMMFSATLSKEIRPVCKKFMQDPMEIYVDDEAKLTLHGLVQHYIKLSELEKNRKLKSLLHHVRKGCYGSDLPKKSILISTWLSWQMKQLKKMTELFYWSGEVSSQLLLKLEVHLSHLTLFLLMDETFLLENRLTLRAISEFGVLLIYFYLCDHTILFGESKKVLPMPLSYNLYFSFREFVTFFGEVCVRPILNLKKKSSM